MPKSKSKNRKRNKMMRQRKKQKEKLQKNEKYVDITLKNRLKQNYEGIDIQIRNRNAEVKISNLVLQLVAPLMDEAKNFDEESNIVGLGVMAWNLGIIKAYKGEEEMLKSMDNFDMMLPNDYKKLLLEFAELKCEKFTDFDQIIYDFEFKSVNSRNNHLTVAYQSVNEN
jgi:hypothetical protein